MALGLTERAASTRSSEGASSTLSPTTSVTAGADAFICLGVGGGKIANTVNDDIGGNTYTIDFTYSDGTRAVSFVRVKATNGIGTGNVITITWSPTTAAINTQLWIQELTGRTLTASPADTSQTGTNNSFGTSFTTGNTATLAQADELVLYVVRGSAGTGTTTYTNPTNAFTTSPLGNSSGCWGSSGGSTAAQAGNMSGTSIKYGSMIVTYKLAAQSVSIVPATVSATSTVSGKVTRAFRILPASIAATSTASAIASALKLVKPATVSATSTASGRVARIGKLTGVSQVSATSTVSGAVYRLRPITPATVSATSTCGASVATLKRVVTAQISATSTVSTAPITKLAKVGGSISAPSTVNLSGIAGQKVLVPAGISATSTVTGRVARQIKLLFGGVSANSTISASIKMTRGVLPATVSATSTVSGAIRTSGKPIIPASVSATSTASVSKIGFIRNINSNPILSSALVIGNLSARKNLVPAGVSSNAAVSAAIQKFAFGWPNADPGDPGDYGQKWRAAHRPTSNGWRKDGYTGPSQTDEFGATYPSRVNGDGGHATLGTAATPVYLTWDRLNGWKATQADGVTSLGNPLTDAGSSYIGTSGGVPYIQNVDIVGRLSLDGVANKIKGDYTLSSTPQDVLCASGNQASAQWAVTGAGFPDLSGSGLGPGPGGYYYARIGNVVCLFQYSTSNTLKNVSTVDGLSHYVYSGQYAYQTDSSGNNLYKMKMRNVRLWHPLMWPIAKVQSTLSADAAIPAVTATQLLYTAGGGATITKGTSPTTVKLQSATGFPTSGKVLIASDIVAYTGISGNNLTGCTWPVGGATCDLRVNAAADTFYVILVDNYSLQLADASGFPSSGTVEIDDQLEVHYQGKSGNTLTGCASGSRWPNNTNRTFPAGYEVRNTVGATIMESYDGAVATPGGANGAGWGCLDIVGGSADVRDCAQFGAGKGPGAFQVASSYGTVIKNHWTDMNWYDVTHIYQQCDKINIYNSIFVSHCGTGGSGTPHVDGVQGWAAYQHDGTPFVVDSAFLGALTNSHEFWNAAGSTTSISASDLPIPDTMYYDNCLLSASGAGGTGGKGGLIDESTNCGAQNSWYDSKLLQVLGGPAAADSVVPNDVLAGATTIPISNISGYTTGAPTTTLTSDVSITREVNFKIILASLNITDASQFANTGRPCFIMLDDGTKQCIIRADYRSSNTLNNIRFYNGVGGTYTAASTTVVIAKTVNTNTQASPNFVSINSDTASRIMVLYYSGISGNTLTGVKCLEYSIPHGAMIINFDVAHLVPLKLLNSNNRQWNVATGGWTFVGSVRPDTIISAQAQLTLAFNVQRKFGGVIPANSAVSGAIFRQPGRIGGNVQATTTVGASAIGIVRKITPSAITATSSVAGAMTNLKHIVLGSPIQANAAVSTNIGALRKPLQGNVAATSSVAAAGGATRAVVPAQIAATSAITTALGAKKQLRAGVLSATSSVSVTNVRSLRALLPAQITATSSVTGTLKGPRRIVAAQVSATSSVIFNLANVKQIIAAQISATSTTVAVLTALKFLHPATATATSTVSGSATRIGFMSPAQINALSTVVGSFKTGRGLAPATIFANTSVLSQVWAKKRINPAQIVATSTVSGSFVAVTFVVPATINATSTMSGSVRALRHLVPAPISAPTVVAASVLQARGVRGTILATSSVIGTPTHHIAVAGTILATSSMTAHPNIVLPIIVAQILATAAVHAGFTKILVFTQIETGRIVPNAPQGRVAKRGELLT